VSDAAVGEGSVSTLQQCMAEAPSRRRRHAPPHHVIRPPARQRRPNQLIRRATAKNPFAAARQRVRSVRGTAAYAARKWKGRISVRMFTAENRCSARSANQTQKVLHIKR